MTEVYWRVERLQRDGTWKQVTSEGQGAFKWNHDFFEDKRDAMKRGAIRLVNNHGHVSEEHTA
jgi:hypothetical protein